MKLCNGSFSHEITQRIAERFAENSRSILLYPCSCGKHVLAENRGGKWLPEPHEVPGTLRQSDMKGHNRKR
jgi:hypothetical protein